MTNNKNRRKFISQAVSLGAATSMLSLGVFRGRLEASPDSDVEKTGLPSLKGRKVLFTWGGWPGHEPEVFASNLVPWIEKEGAEVSVYTSLDPYTDKSIMDNTDLVIQIFTMSSITQEQEKGLLAAIKNGTGMAGWHGGMCDAFRNNPEYQYMTGGQWVAHPGGVIDYDVNITNREDPITAGLADFKVTSEQYYMHVDPNMKVLATTTFKGNHNSWIDGCVMPVIWKKMYGKGRIFYTSLGHNLAHIVDAPNGLEIIKRGMKWASASKYEAAERLMFPVYSKS
jgi:type 1 glutamine amidotransferase